MTNPGNSALIACMTVILVKMVSIARVAIPLTTFAKMTLKTLVFSGANLSQGTIPQDGMTQLRENVTQLAYSAFCNLPIVRCVCQIST